MTSTTPRRVRLAVVAVFGVFMFAGMTFASWASRLPTVRDLLSFDPDQMGLLLLFGAFGSLLALPISGRLVAWLGARNTVLAAALLGIAGMSFAVYGVTQASPVLVGAGLFVSMMGVGAWDMAMNFAGTVVERALGRAIMPWFHGGFSIGAAIGAAGGTFAARHGLSVSAHMTIALAVIAVCVAGSVFGFLPDGDSDAGVDGTEGGTPSEQKVSFARTWLEGRTLLVGLVVLAAALTEGAANDWLALAVVDGFGQPDDVGALAFTIFIVAMTLMRFGGTWLLDRFGRLLVLRLCTGLAIVGLVIFCFVDSLPVAIVGAVLWGFGAALGFPVGMSAASDDPARAAARLSVVSTIGYSAFLLGPPLLGFIADHIGYRLALSAVLVPLVLSLFALPAAKPRTADQAH